MNRREYQKLAERSQYDSVWRKWRQGYAPKFRLNIWRRLQMIVTRKVLTALARRKPDDPNILMALGALSKVESIDQLGRGNAETAAQLRWDAIQKSREAVALAPNDPHNRLMLGTALDTDQQHDAAFIEYQEILRLDPFNPQGHTLVALSLKRQGKLNEAIEEQRQGLALAPTASNHLHLGALLNKAGYTEEAKENWHKVLELDKSHIATAARLHLQGKD